MSRWNLKTSRCALWVLRSAVLIGGCGDHESPTEPVGSGDKSRDEPGDGGARALCESQEDGKACGTDLHCAGGGCVPDRCGDGLITGREACDDGNELSGDGCDARCREESACGNAEVDPGEECDDGNWNDHDGCTNRCKAQRCGNGRLDDNEECDDGNQSDRDGCSNSCLVLACRNGRLEPGEECDDGNQVDQGDGCTNACLTSICGNGKVEKYEDCDDGNRVDTDACANNCIRSVCGDGVRQPPETCERGEHRVILTSGEGGALAGVHQGCTTDCKGWTADDPCVACQKRACTNVADGIDVEGGCYRAVDTQFGASSDDADFLRHCVEAVQCSIEKRCFDNNDSRYRGLRCYCGTTTDQCATNGPSLEAPCRAPWEAAARSEQSSEVLGIVSDLSYPAGWVFTLLGCYQESRNGACATECADQRRVEPEAAL